MSTKPSASDFMKWVQNDENQSKVRHALMEYPDLANMKDSVSFNRLIFTSKYYHTMMFSVILIGYVNIQLIIVVTILYLYCGYISLPCTKNLILYICYSY